MLLEKEYYDVKTYFEEKFTDSEILRFVCKTDLESKLMMLVDIYMFWIFWNVEMLYFDTTNVVCSIDG
jgi:hypothetical protein